jgi:hypothetical protein
VSTVILHALELLPFVFAKTFSTQLCRTQPKPSYHKDGEQADDGNLAERNPALTEIWARIDICGADLVEDHS